MERRHHGDAALAGVGLRGRPGDAQPPAGEVDVGAVEPAQLRDAQAAQDQGLDDHASRHVVAVAVLRVAIPKLASADLADQRVRDSELACEPDSGAARGTDHRHGLPGQSAGLGLDQVGCPQHRRDLLGLEERAARPVGLGRRGLQRRRRPGEDAPLVRVAEKSLGVSSASRIDPLEMPRRRAS